MGRDEQLEPFRRTGGSVVLRLDDQLAALLSQLVRELVALLDEGMESQGPVDPLAAMVGIDGSSEPPTDPALARILPDAYLDDPEAAADFRRYTEGTLRGLKRTRAGMVQATLTDATTGRPLDAEEVQAWLTTLTDLRLALATRLEVSEDPDADAERLEGLADDDPELFQWMVYELLAELQVSLVHTLG